MWIVALGSAKAGPEVETQASILTLGPLLTLKKPSLGNGAIGPMAQQSPWSAIPTYLQTVFSFCWHPLLAWGYSRLYKVCSWRLLFSSLQKPAKARSISSIAPPPQVNSRSHARIHPMYMKPSQPKIAIMGLLSKIVGWWMLACHSKCNMLPLTRVIGLTSLI